MKTAEIKGLLEDMLELGKTRVVIDTSYRGIKVPPSFMNVGPTVFILAWNYPGIDLQIGKRIVKATLKFQGQPFRCTFPLKSIRSILSMDKKPDEPKPAKKKTKEFETAGMFKEKDDLPKTGLGRKGTLTLLK
jgi:stringent starvation protein B